MTVMTRRIIKHRNRRLYDALEGKVITLLELSDLVASGENVAVELKGTGEDITAVTLLASFAERIRRRPCERLCAEVSMVLSRALRGAVEEPVISGKEGAAGGRDGSAGFES